MNGLAGPAIAAGAQVLSNMGPGPDPLGQNPRFTDHRRLAHLWALFGQGANNRVIDSAHFHLEYPNLVLLPLWLLAKTILRFRWVKVVHDGSLPSRFGSFTGMQKWLFKMAVKNIDEMVVVSSELEAWMTQTAGFEKKLSLIPSLLPPLIDETVEPVSNDLADTLRRYSQHNRRVCSIGVFIASYGFDQVAAAVETLRGETGEDIGLLLIDGTFALDENYRSSTLNGRDWIDVAENIPHGNLEQVFKMSDVFVRAFDHESFGLSRVEAIWAGTPVIATDAGETRGMMIYRFGDLTQMTNHLRAVFAGEGGHELAASAETFSKEAESNLANYLRVIAGDEK